MDKNIENLTHHLRNTFARLIEESNKFGMPQESSLNEMRNTLILMHRANIWQPGIVVQVEKSPVMQEIIEHFDVLWDQFNNGPIFEKMKEFGDEDKMWEMVGIVGVRLSKLRPLIVTSDPTTYGFAAYYAEAVKCWAYGLNRAAAILCCSVIEEVITGEIAKEEKDFAISLNYSEGIPISISTRTFHKIIEAAYDRTYLTEEQYQQAEEIRIIRNRILHEMEDVSEEESLKLISSTRSIIQSLLSEVHSTPPKKYSESDYQKAFKKFQVEIESFFEKMKANLNQTFSLNDEQEKQFKKLFKMNVWNPGEIVQVHPKDEKFANGFMLMMMYDMGFTEDNFIENIVEEDHERIAEVVHSVVERGMQIRPTLVTINPSIYGFSAFNKEAVRAWVLGHNRAAFVLCVSVVEDVIGEEIIKVDGAAGLHLIYEKDRYTGVGRSKMRNLLKKAAEVNIINIDQAKNLRKLVSKRNKILHGMQEVGSKETLKAIEQTRTIIEDILNEG
jgi:hypothetical protein